MRRLLSVLLSFCLFSVCNAQNDVDKSLKSKAEAESLAIDFMQKHFGQPKTRAFSDHKTGISTSTRMANNKTMLYICNFDDGGYAIVSARNVGCGDILAYSSTGHFDYEKAPESARYIVDIYAKNIASSEISEEIKMADRSMNKLESIAAVEPLLGSTMWNQGYPYNLCSPQIDGVPTVTGCVPTAMAQIMYYYKYPQSGFGNIEYEWNNTKLKADLSTSTYKWDVMTPQYDEQSTEESKLAVSRLMTDIGFACNTQFGVESSSTPNIYPSVAFVKNFQYDSSLRWLEKRFFSNEEWTDIIMEEIRSQRPIYYSGDNAYRTGHAYVCDGIDTEGRLHFNFGWGGECDGYYIADNQLFGNSSEMICNIKPDQGGSPIVEGYLYSSFYFNGNNILLNMKIMAGGARDIPVEIALEYKNGDSAFYVNRISETAYLWMEMLLNPVTPELSGMKDGEYEIRPVFRVLDKEEDKGASGTVNGWQYFHHIPGSQYYLDGTISQGSVTIKNTMEEPIDEGRVQIDDLFYILDDNTCEATVTYRNKINPTYSGDVVIPSSVEYDGRTYTVTMIGESAFEVCRGLESVTIPKTVRIIGYGAFSQSWAKEIKFEEGSQLEIIDEYAFNAMDELQKIKLPEGLKEIRLAGLRGLNVRAIDIPSSVTYIGPQALDGYKCRDITLHWEEPLECDYALEQKQFHYTEAFNIHVPKGSEEKYAKVKPWCDHEIDSKTPVAESPVVISQDGIYYELYYDATVVRPDNDEDLMRFNNKESIVIPSIVTYKGRDFVVKRIGEGSISGAELSSVSLPSSVVKIENFNFTSCSNLETVNFAEDSQLKIIGQNCFQWCDQLNEILLPADLKRIGFLSLSHVPLTEIDLPANVRMIDGGAFQYCGNMVVRCHTAFPPYVQYDAFNPDNYPVFEGSDITVIVPKDCKKNYKSYEFWKNKNIVEDESMLPAIDIKVTSSKSVTIMVPQQEGADYYNVVVTSEDGTVVDSRTIGNNIRTRSVVAGLSCDLNLYGEDFYQFSIEAYSNDKGKLKELTGQFNTLSSSISGITPVVGGVSSGNNRTYNLIGQQVSVPNKGIYIKNKKKVIIK